ncbi:MAG TPA: DNRLRE domain-containing protein [Anaerohalosphaeraceae bacterium]|nr:DNRLRE domain-containing protein [Anaerohalosphaeraceae bacterium]HQG05395.1 DNRLRE domain-containing protein [Anaerohalosphaeraceae bacterium]HQI06768.1 DNRLRE domain-containing protein [Anaerohalosphaeraceae bacterium]HQJ67189.1 DNRLRE domain-containing protein [Anaerohalosphaeraceae bacterium]
MTRTFQYTFLSAFLAMSAFCSAEVLLDDTFADGSRTETNLPTESAVWVSHPTSVTTAAGSLAYTQSTGSQKLWTYFTPNGSPVSLGVGEQLIATIVFTPRGALYNTTSKNFRFGLFYDPTDAQFCQDSNTDSGNGQWIDATGYAVHFPLSSGPTGANASLGKRVPNLTDSLLGSGTAYPNMSSGGNSIVASLDTAYTLTLALKRTSESAMEVTFSIADGGGVLSTHSITDDAGIYTKFDQLFFRFSKAEGTADVIDFHSFKVEYIPAIPVGQCENIGTLVSAYAVQSCRTELFDGTNPRVNDNRHDASKLSVRGDSKASKSWIKFDLRNLGITDPNNLRSATLRITLHEGKTGTCSLSYVKDICRDNINWAERDLTWNNAPGNIPSDDGINPRDTAFAVADLQKNLDPAKAAFLATVDYSAGGVAGQQFFFDVLPALRSDTDGIVQFVLHNASGLTNFATHDHASGEAYWPKLEILIPPAGADNPYPCPGQKVNSNLVGLSWTNPDPNDGVSPIICTVYLGTEPNRLQMDHVTLGPDEHSVLINTDNFRNFGNLVNHQVYWWVVDCEDPSRDNPLIEGLMWSFFVQDNEAPIVNAGFEQVIWLTETDTVQLEGTAEDDGQPEEPGTLTYTWARTAGPETAVLSNPNQLSTTVTFAERGDYTFTLTADDGELKTSASVRVVVGDNACDASHLSTGKPYDAGDVNHDCIVNLEDFAILFGNNWLDCTNTLAKCE